MTRNPTACAPHREFLAAIADGEIDLVPTATLEHVKHCPECRREIQTHQLLTSRLRQASTQLTEPTPAPRRLPFVAGRFRIIAAAVACAILIAAGGVGWFLLTRPDPVTAAVNASTLPLQIQSTDPTRIGQWCLSASGRAVPAIELDGMQVIGARMDRIASTDIVTVVYAAPSGARVSVSWLEGPGALGSGVEDRQISGHELLVVHSAMGVAVVLGSSNEAMWRTAAAIESSASLR
jgi:hypothetical protein